MQVTYNSNGSLVVVVDGSNQKEIFEKLAEFQEVFNLKHTINGTEVDPAHIRLVVREVDDNKFYEMRYTGPDKDLWGYKLQFGSHKKGNTLFPRYKMDEDEADKYENGGNGWYKWIGDNKSNKKSSSKKTSKSNDDEDAPF